jgi:hypothetical protein
VLIYPRWLNDLCLLKFDVEELSVGKIIKACWANQITAEQVAQDIAGFMG